MEKQAYQSGEMQFEAHVSPSTMSWGFTQMADGYLLLGMLDLVTHMVKNKLAAMVQTPGNLQTGTVPPGTRTPLTVARGKGPSGGAS